MIQYDEEARRFTHQLVDLLFDHVQTIESRPVVDWKSSTELRELVRIGETADPIDLVKRVAAYSIQL
ncbi:MAG: hypothetical protein ABI837_03440, partial [Acidobacteriota bacterium]